MLRYYGDGGPTTSAGLYSPQKVHLDNTNGPHYYMYICDQQSMAVRRVSRMTGIISTFAGSGVCGSGGDGLAATASGAMLDPLYIFVSGQSAYIS